MYTSEGTLPAEQGKKCETEGTFMQRSTEADGSELHHFRLRVYLNSFDDLVRFAEVATSSQYYQEEAKQVIWGSISSKTLCVCRGSRAMEDG